MAENKNIDELSVDDSSLEELSVDDSSLEELVESKNEDTSVIDDITIQNEKKLNKQNKTKKILFSLIGVLSLSIIIVLSLFFSGFFDPEEVSKSNKKPNNTSKVLEKNEDYFDKTDIDINKLNNKLKMLTKEELNFDSDEDIKKEKKLEEKKINEDKKKFDDFKKQARIEARLEEEKRRLIEEKKKLEIQKQELEKKRDELEKLQKEIENKKLQEEIENKQSEKKLEVKEVKEEIKEEVKLEINKIKQESAQSKPTEVKELIKKENTDDLNNFVKLINVVSIKGNLYKSYLKKIEKINRNLLLCRDHLNRIDIYFGPYLNEEEREKAIQGLYENGFDKSYGIDLTKEEYKNRCKY